MAIPCRQHDIPKKFYGFFRFLKLSVSKMSIIIRRQKGDENDKTH
jgi:hypothetical protein